MSSTVDLALQRKIHKLVSPMNLPAHRKAQNTPANYEWLYKNIKTHNSAHPNFPDAVNALEKILGLDK
jgi:hypothetical protein